MQRSRLRLPKGLANDSGLRAELPGNGLQVNFFQAYRQQRVVVYLLVGTRLVGEILDYDQYSLLLSDPHGTGQLIYKHSISNIQVIEEMA